MPRRKKKEEKTELVINCPVRRHRHKLRLDVDPERPDLMVGYCGKNIVYRAPFNQEAASQVTNENVYTVPNFSFEEDEGE